MFSVSGVSIEVEVTIPGNAPSIDQYTTGAMHKLEVLNFFPIAIDIDVECGTSAGKIAFASGATWTRYLPTIPANTTVWGKGFVTNEPVAKAAGAIPGSDVVACNRLKYRFNGASGWNPDHHPTAGHTVMVTVA